MVQSYTLSQRPDLCPDKDNDNENIIMLPDDMFLNLIDTNLQEKIAMSNDLDGNAAEALKPLLEQGPTTMTVGLNNWTKLKPKMDETFYSTKGRITSTKIQIYSENW